MTTTITAASFGILCTVLLAGRTAISSYAAWKMDKQAQIAACAVIVGAVVGAGLVNWSKSQPSSSVLQEELEVRTHLWHVSVAMSRDAGISDWRWARRRVSWRRIQRAVVMTE